MKDGQVATNVSLMFPLSNKLRVQFNGTGAADSKVLFEYSAAGTGNNKGDVATTPLSGSDGLSKSSGSSPP